MSWAFLGLRLSYNLLFTAYIARDTSYPHPLSNMQQHQVLIGRSQPQTDCCCIVSSLFKFRIVRDIILSLNIYVCDASCGGAGLVGMSSAALIGLGMHVESAHAPDRCRSDSAGFCNETSDVNRDELPYLLLPGKVVECTNASLDPFGSLHGRGGGGHGESRRGDSLCCPPPLPPRPAGRPWKSPLTPPHLRSLLHLLLKSCFCCSPPRGFTLLLLVYQGAAAAAADSLPGQQLQQPKRPGRQLLASEPTLLLLTRFWRQFRSDELHQRELALPPASLSGQPSTGLPELGSPAGREISGRET